MASRLLLMLCAAAAVTPVVTAAQPKKPHILVLLADDNLCCGMYHEGKVAISGNLATPGFPQCNHTVSKLSADAGSLCSEV